MQNLFHLPNLALKPTKIVIPLILCGNIFGGQVAWTQTTQLEQDKEEELKKRLIPNPIIHLDPVLLTPSNTGLSIDFNQDVSNTKASYNNTNNESLPCFDIHTITFTAINGANANLGVLKEALGIFQASGRAFDKLLESNNINRCMNIHDINKVASLAQNRLIDQGFVTTRVVITDQDLSSGTLILTVILGTIGQIHGTTNDSKVAVHHRSQPTLNLDQTLPANFGTALPLKSGDILNIRQLETALENFKRVPSTDASFELAPSQSGVVGESDILIDYKQDRSLRTFLYIDDSGSDATGKYSANISLSLDNIANMNDLFYLSYGHSFNHLNKRQSDSNKQNSKNYSLGYVLPINKTTYNFSTNHYDYDQTVTGINQDYIYSGQSHNMAAGMSRLIHRDARSKTHLSLSGFSKTQKNFVDETEIEVQRRRVSGWTAGIKHETALGKSRLSLGLNYQRGTGAFGAITPPEKLFNEGDSRVGIIKFNADMHHPFTLNAKPFAYDATFKGQYAKDALVPSERISIGGRHSVRGFDGERTLSADHGALLQQNILAPLSSFTNKSQLANHQLYLGLDVGYVKMHRKDQDELLLGNHLIGGAIGLKGQTKRQSNPYQSLNYDIFASHPLYAPKGFFGRTSNGDDKDGEWVYGFSVGVGF